MVKPDTDSFYVTLLTHEDVIVLTDIALVPKLEEIIECTVYD